jgi:acyl carrier protein
MTLPNDRQIIAGQLCRFARTNLVAPGTDFNEHSLLADVGIDSFSLVELLLFSERTFGITVPESHLTHEHLATLATLARCIAGLARGGASAPPASN